MVLERIQNKDDNCPLQTFHFSIVCFPVASPLLNNEKKHAFIVSQHVSMLMLCNDSSQKSENWFYYTSCERNLNISFDQG